MNIQLKIQQAASDAVEKLYAQSVSPASIQVNITRKDQKGDFTVVVFPLLKISKKSPDETGKQLGEEIIEAVPEISEYEVVKGFLNLSLSATYWRGIMDGAASDESYGYTKATDKSPLVMIEYSSPNTNKPLHLGHIRNNLLGASLARLVSVCGNKVVKTNIVNDRGIHICKSMLAWKKWGEGATPKITGIKGDHLVGDYYVRFDKEFKAELKSIIESSPEIQTMKGKNDDETKEMQKAAAEAKSTLMAEAREMLVKWEQGDAEVRNLWETMNSWVYAGFDETYKMLGVDFDKIYYESQTYKVGKEKVLEGLASGQFYRREDGSVWADLTKDGLDEKLLLRKDGTSVYMTQDIGTAKTRFDDYPIDKMVYVVGNEQNYHFQVLSILLDRLGFKWGKDLVHFSYGMVELPEGKMKSREGTVVDADDLVGDMINTAREMGKELGRLDGLTEEECERTYRILALGALKYFILKVDPRKNMTFNPKESIDFNGNTGPFIQYAYARIQSVLRKAAEAGETVISKANEAQLLDKEIQLLRQVEQFPAVVAEAGEVYSPALIANYAYDLAKEYNQYYHDVQIMKEPDVEVRQNRLLLSYVVARVLKNAVWVLGIEMPERM
ncbi:MAG: arginine--tRNA ligase [Marinilabiliaceae bacterium]|nr:arginine--tRNA ligase [Marinilabiliaceae bacterium]